MRVAQDRLAAANWWAPIWREPGGGHFLWLNLVCGGGFPEEVVVIAVDLSIYRSQRFPVVGEALALVAVEEADLPDDLFEWYALFPRDGCRLYSGQRRFNLPTEQLREIGEDQALPDALARDEAEAQIQDHVDERYREDESMYRYPERVRLEEVGPRALIPTYYSEGCFDQMAKIRQETKVSDLPGFLDKVQRLASQIR